jgi:hypothetical protein
MNAYNVAQSGSQVAIFAGRGDESVAWQKSRLYSLREAVFGSFRDLFPKTFSQEFLGGFRG